MIIRLLWTILWATWMPVYFLRYQRVLLIKRKCICITAWCISLLISICIDIGEKGIAQVAALTALAFLLATIAIIDYENKVIPNHLQLHLAAAGLSEYVILYLMEKDDLIYKLPRNLLAGFGVFAILLLIALLSKGLGGGDVKLLGLLGCICGYTITVSILFWALVSSAFVSIILLIRRVKNRKDTIPFAPFIWIGYLISMVMLYKDFWRI